MNCANCVFTSFKAFRSDDSGEPQIIPFVTGQAEYETQFGGLVAGAEYTFTVISQSGDKEGHGSSTTQQISELSLIRSSSFLNFVLSLKWF